MIQRLHLEEAEASSYAISPARESREAQDGTENESLALEFQTLLAQISGQIGGIPDQSIAVGLALAQTAITQTVHREEHTQTDSHAEDSQERDPGIVLSNKDTKSAPVSRDVGKVRDDHDDQDTKVDADAGPVQTQINPQLSDDNQGQLDEQGQVLQDVQLVEQDVRSEVIGERISDATVSSGVSQDTVAALEVIQNQVSGNQELHTDRQVLAQDVQANSGITLEQIHAEPMKKKAKHAEKEMGVDSVAASAVAPIQRDLNANSNIQKDGAKEQQTKGSSQDLQDGARTVGQPAIVDAAAKNQSSGGDLNQRQDFEDSLSKSQNQKLAEGGQKTQKAPKEAQDADLAGFIGSPGGRSFEKASEGTIQMTILRQAFESLRANRADGAEARAKNSSPQVTATTTTQETKSAQAEQGSRTSKTLTRPQTAKMLERVESALKEAARSRDGRTISLHLEPVNLGKVKVDVSLREGALHARIAPENQQVISTLRDHAHELQGALRALGLDVESVTVSVTSDQFDGEMATGGQMFDGRSFQDERNNMPHETAQVVEKTVGNELAERTSASADQQGSAAGKALDHWVA